MKKSNVFRKLLGMAAAVCMMALLLGMTTLAADKVETIAFGETKENYDQDAGIVHYYKFQVKQPGLISVTGVAATLAGIPRDLRVSLCDAKGKVLTTDYVNAMNSVVKSYAVNKGVYQFKVQAAEKFIISTGHKKYIEKSGTTQKKAVSMKKKKAITGVVGIGESAKKTDWYKIVLKKSARITLECDVVSSSNIYIEVIPSKKITSIRGKHTIALGNERGERGKVTFQTTTGKKLPTGTYYIKVHRNSRNASTNGIYRIKWTK